MENEMENVDEITNLFEMMFVENPPEEMEINVPVDTSPNPLNDLNSKSFKSKRIVKHTHDAMTHKKSLRLFFVSQG